MGMTERRKRATPQAHAAEELQRLCAEVAELRAWCHGLEERQALVLVALRLIAETAGQPDVQSRVLRTALDDPLAGHVVEEHRLAPPSTA
jgi:hypothetical protein